MKSLQNYLLEELEGAATPGNTMGMGNPMPAGVTSEFGTEPPVDHTHSDDETKTAKCKKEKCNKKKKHQCK